MGHTVGLRRGCSVLPMLLRWVMENVFDAFPPPCGCGIRVRGPWLMYDREEPRRVEVQPERLRRRRGTSPDWTCAWAIANGRASVETIRTCRVRPRSQHEHSLRMEEAPNSARLNILGSYVLIDCGHAQEFREDVRSTWVLLVGAEHSIGRWIFWATPRQTSTVVPGSARLLSPSRLYLLEVSCASMGHGSGDFRVRLRGDLSSPGVRILGVVQRR